jgi:hypothetical protein
VRAARVGSGTAPLRASSSASSAQRSSAFSAPQTIARAEGVAAQAHDLERAVGRVGPVQRQVDHDQGFGPRPETTDADGLDARPLDQAGARPRADAQARDVERDGIAG